VAAKKQEVKVAPKRRAAKKPFDVRQLWRFALWSVTAGCALGLAVLASRGEPGSERLAALIATLHGQTAPPPFDAKVETKKLADALHGLSAENDMLRSRLAAVEHHEQQIDSVTGSLSKQIEVVKAEAEAPRPSRHCPRRRRYQHQRRPLPRQRRNNLASISAAPSRSRRYARDGSRSERHTRRHSKV
jgi:hypothetical protein